MGQYAVLLLIAIATIALTYLCCLRPMRHHDSGASSTCCASNSPDASTANEIAALSREIEALRQSMGDPAEAAHRGGAGQADIPN